MGNTTINPINMIEGKLYSHGRILFFLFINCLLLYPQSAAIYPIKDR